MNRVYGKGLNIFRQLGNLQPTFVNEFQPLPDLDRKKVKWLHGGFFQSYFALQDGQIVYMGYPMYSYVTGRALWYHLKFPRLLQLYQKHSRNLLGKVLSFNNYATKPILLNGGTESDHKDMSQFKMGNCNLFILSNGNVFSMGENSHGQLGTGTNRYAKTFERVALPPEETVIDVSSNFSHTLFATNSGRVYGCGKGNRSRIVPQQFHHNGFLKQSYVTPTLISREYRIVKTACGTSHSVFLSADNKVYALGYNEYGQCGHNTMRTKQIKQMSQIFCHFSKYQRILDIKCGFHHTLIQTEQHVYFLGSTVNNEFPFDSLIGKHSVCSPQIVPMEGRPKKIFASFDRSAILSEDNTVYLFGGRHCNKREVQSFKQGVNPDTEVGLGYQHTLISV